MFICESSGGEIKRECERCKNPVHALVSQTFGVVYFDGTLPPKELHFRIDGKMVGKMVVDLSKKNKGTEKLEI